MRQVKIVATSGYFPGRPVSAEEIDLLTGSEPGWTAENTGVLRRWFSCGEKAPEAGARAAFRVLEEAGLQLADMDLLVAACGTQAQPLPSNSALILEAMGGCGIHAFDVNCTCLSFVVALDQVACMIAAGRCRRALIVSSDVASVGLNFRERESAALMGDGAAAVIVEVASPESCRGIFAARLETYPEGAHYAEIRGAGSSLHPIRGKGVREEDFFFRMDGTQIFRLACKHIEGFCGRLLEVSGMTPGDFDLVIPHQASLPALELIRRRLKVDASRFYICIGEQGNCIGASIPLALHHAIREGRLRRGYRVLLLGTAAGFSVGGLGMVF